MSGLQVTPGSEMGMAGSPARTYARIIGILFLLSLVAGGFGEFYVPSTLIVPGDAAATANNIHAHATMFRLGFAGYLVEAICDTGLTWTLYLLLRPVRRDLALLAVLFRVTGTTIFAIAELFYFSASFILGGAGYLKTFSPDQLNTVALLALKMYGYGGELFMVFYGLPSILLGYLMFESGFLPRPLGGLFLVAGIGFVAKSFALVLAPHFPSSYLLLPMPVSALFVTGWFLFKGVDVQKWEARAAASR